MYFNICASGSKGNATLVGNDKTLLLIDMGVSLQTLKDGLNEINKDIKDIHNTTEKITKRFNSINQVDIDKIGM